MCLHPFDQKILPCQDFLCLSCVCFQYWRVFNANMRKDSLGELVHWIMEAEKSHNRPLTS
jgi:hypothetical protein